MSELDVLVKDKLVPFRKEIIEAMREKHADFIGIVESAMAGRENKFGLMVTENGRIAGEYTFIVNGIDIERVETGVLESEIRHPLLGGIKPYAVIEKNDIELVIENKEFLTDTFAAAKKFLPKMTLKFLP